MDQLAGSVVLITGGSKGIGRAAAFRLASLGCKVAICARDSGALQSTEAELKIKSRNILARSADVTNAADVQLWVDTVLDKWGRIDIVINNAGVMRSGKIHELTVADWDLQYAVNIKGPFLVTKAVLPAMMAQKQGILIYISSTAALISPPGNACYASTKWGLDGMTGSFARELCEYGIKCHTLRPGYVDTHLFDADSRPTNPEIDWIAPEEIANCIEFLCRLPAHAQVPDLNYTTTYQRKKY